MAEQYDMTCTKDPATINRLLSLGWEPFAVTVESDGHRIWLRAKQIVPDVTEQKS